MEDIYKQALLDAKAVRASAMANAKASLQEAFEPKIQEMIRLKLSEELEEELDEMDEKNEADNMEEVRGGAPLIVPANDADDLEGEAEYFQQMLQDAGIMARVEAGFGELEIYLTNPMDKRKAARVIADAGYSLAEGKKKMEEGDMEEGDMDEASLEEILAELDELAKQEEGDNMEEGEMEEGDNMEEAEDDEESEDEESDDDSEEEAETEEVDDETKIIDITLGDLKAVLQSIQGGGDMNMDSEEESGEDSSEEGSEEDVTLGEVDLDEILNSLQEEKDKEKEDAKKEGKKMEEKKKNMEEKKKMEEVRSNLSKANKTIEVLRAELNEVNLLNAKLLYMNRIFKAKNLSESQKVSVVSALDRASNVKEAKNIYETLKENIQPKKSQLVESKGFASKPAGVAPKKPIVDSDPYVSRWQKIAGIK